MWENNLHLICETLCGSLYTSFIYKECRRIALQLLKQQSFTKSIFQYCCVKIKEMSILDILNKSLECKNNQFHELFKDSMVLDKKFLHVIKFLANKHNAKMRSITHELNVLKLTSSVSINMELLKEFFVKTIEFGSSNIFCYQKISMSIVGTKEIYPIRNVYLLPIRSSKITPLPASELAEVEGELKRDKAFKNIMHTLH